MNFFYLLLILMAVLRPGFTHARVINDEQLWLNLNSFISLKNEWLVYGEFQPRLFPNNQAINAILYRAALGRNLGRGFSVWLGHAYISFSYPMKFSEDRPFLQLMHGQDMGKWRLINRFRFEVRHFRSIENEVYRPRHLIRGQYHWTKSWAFIIWNEWFWNLNTVNVPPTTRITRTRQGFDQNRFFAGLGYSLGDKKQHLLDLGYLNQYINGLSFDRSNHILAMQLTLRY